MPKKPKILLVEDDRLFLWSLDHFLQKEGYEVCSVSTGEMAMDLAQRTAFDLVISDFHLNGLDGKELLKRLKALQPRAKTILISAYQREEIGCDQEMPLNGYLNKPIELERLKQLIQNVTVPA